jgi:hypothetical protein
MNDQIKEVAVAVIICVVPIIVLWWPVIERVLK